MSEVQTVPDEREGRRKIALLKAVGLDRVAEEQRELALNLAKRYDLDLLLKHLVLIEGRAYITRDGLLHVAHRSGVLDGIETTEPELVGEFWRAQCSVYRKDMSRPFTYGGRYPAKGGNAKYAPEMAVKVAEVAALRRAFDVSAPTVEERWTDVADPEPPAPAATLAERVAAARERAIVKPDAEVAVLVEPMPETESAGLPGACGAVFDDETDDPCVLLPDHDGPHHGQEGVWPR